MITYDDEKLILKEFQNYKDKEVALFGNFFECKKILYKVRKSLKSSHWVNSSSKCDSPPDFYNDKAKLMMDVMRIDDHAFVDKNGKVQNLTLQKENEVLKKYFGKDYKKKNESITCYVTAWSGLPTKQDHSYQKYLDNFKRVFYKHNNQIELYKKNHPGFKTIFFIFDESCAYIEVTNDKELNKPTLKGDITYGKPHYFCLDKNFIDIIKNSNVDYVVWSAPWKLLNSLEKGMIKFPKAVIIDVKNIKEEMLIKYNIALMKESEE